MVVLVSSQPRERAALAALCRSRGRAWTECDSLRAFRHLLHDGSARIVITRQRLADAFSDDVMAALVATGRFTEVRVIVLLEAGSTAVHEARQIELGANTVLRDPIRAEVLVAYMEKYWSEVAAGRVASLHAAAQGSFEFAGASVFPLERQVRRGKATIRVTPRELTLIKFLFEARGQVVTYHTLYADMFGRRFRGDTSNLRVLLGKLAGSFQALRVPLRRHVEVIPKTGYRYLPPAAV